jgi:hypothetical protein
MDQGTHNRAVSFIWQLRTMLMHHLFKRGKTSTQVKMVTSHNNLKNDFRLRLKDVISIVALKSGPCRHCRWAALSAHASRIKAFCGHYGRSPSVIRQEARESVRAAFCLSRHK